MPDILHTTLVHWQQRVDEKCKLQGSLTCTTHAAPSGEGTTQFTETQEPTDGSLSGSVTERPSSVATQGVSVSPASPVTSTSPKQPRVRTSCVCTEPSSGRMKLSRKKAYGDALFEIWSLHQPPSGGRARGRRSSGHRGGGGRY
jgi:hypothetical protein